MAGRNHLRQNRRAARYLFLPAVLCAVLAGPVDMARAAADETLPVLILRVINQAGISGDVLLEASGHLQRIYRKAGVRIIWQEQPYAVEAIAHTSALEFTVILVPERIASKMHEGKTVSGFAPSHEGKGLRRAYVFADRVGDFLTGEGEKIAEEGRVLGHIIAHEVGHLMLPPGHTLIGIMRPTIDQRALDDAARGTLLFTPEQSERVHEVARRGTAEYCARQSCSTDIAADFPQQESEARQAAQ